MRFRLQTLFVIVSVAAGLALGVRNAQRGLRTVRSSAAARFVAHMCVEHMKSNNGSWPRDWADLRDDFQTCQRRSGQAWSFEELQRRVAIDTAADPRRIDPKARGADAANSGLVWSRHGQTTHGPGRDPNAIILDYIESTAP